MGDVSWCDQDRGRPGRGSCARRRSPAARLTRASRISEPLPRARLLAAIGVIAGLASGLLGVGGGFLIVPLLAVWMKMNQRRTSGTSLAAILPIAVVGACIYYFFRGAHQVDITMAVFLVLGSVIGAYLGARTIDLVPERLLKVFIAILLLAVGLDEILSGLVPGALLAGHHPATHDALAYSLVVLSGVLIGVLSGLTGVGGGIFIVPTLVLGFGLSQHLAQGTSLVAILPTATVGAAVHLRRGNVDLRAAAWIGAAGAPAAVAGAALALVLPQPVLAILFGLFLLFAASRLWPRRNTVTPVESPMA